MMRDEQLDKKTITIAIIVVLLIAMVTIGIAMKSPKEPVATFAESLRFPVGEKITLSDVVTDVKDGTLVNPNTPLDSSKEGKFKITFTLSNSSKVESEGTVVIEFYQPEIETETEEPITKEEQPTKEDPNKKEPDEEEEEEPIVSPFGEDGKPVDGIYKTKNGKTLEIKDGFCYVDGFLLVNKSYSLPKSYNPGKLTAETQAAYDQLLAAAKEAGVKMKVDNGFRSWDIQNMLFTNYVKNDSLENALTYSARPGHSEHQTGLALDLLLSNSIEATWPENKVILDWLDENAYKFGFILRYPEGKTDITGYIYEPWHFRYVGTELAETLYNDGDWITMEEYFGVDSVYRGY